VAPRNRATARTVVVLSCDMCDHDALARCATCTMDVCCRHARMLSGKVQCTRCYARVAPMCLDCRQPSTSTCATCPQRLCKHCARGCMVVHKGCKRTPLCRGCAATVLTQCGICKANVCVVQKVSCVCSGEVAVCTSCYLKSTIDCMTPDCMKVCCSRCIVSTCRVCLAVHCNECKPAQTVTLCATPFCKQPVCERCAVLCEACGATTCADHTPVRDFQCPACVRSAVAE
jgi:hypothetical protein